MNDVSTPTTTATTRQPSTTTTTTTTQPQPQAYQQQLTVVQLEQFHPQCFACGRCNQQITQNMKFGIHPKTKELMCETCTRLAVM